MFDVITQNRELAIKAEGGNIITKTGAYSLKILQAEIAKTPNGAQFIELYVEDTETQARNFTRFYMTKVDGTPSFGANIFNAMMVCMGVTQCTPTRGKVWDQKMQVKQGETYVLPEIVNKFVGLILRRRNREYQGTDGQMHTSFNMEPISAFDPQTKRTAAEIIKGSPEAKGMERRLAQTLAKEAEEAAKPKPAAPAYRQSAPTAPTNAPLANDDVPF